MELQFCDKCGRKITEAELESGDALMLGEQFFCPQCKAVALSEMTGSQTERAAPPVAARTRSSRRPALPEEAPPKRASERGTRTSGPRKSVSGRGTRTSGPREAVGARKTGPQQAVGARKSSRLVAVGPGGGGRVSGREQPRPKSSAPIVIAVAAAVMVGAVVAVIVFGSSGETKKPAHGAQTPVASQGGAQPPAGQTAPAVQAQSPTGDGGPQVPADAKGANDLPPLESPDAPKPGADVLKLATADSTDEKFRCAAAAWRAERSESAGRFGSGFKVTPGARADTVRADALEIRFAKEQDLSQYRKVGLWLGGRNADGNLAKVSLKLASGETTSLTGAKPVEYGTRWKFYAFDLVGKVDNAVGLTVEFNAGDTPRAPRFEAYVDEAVAFDRKETEVANAPPSGETAGPSTVPSRPGPSSETSGPSETTPPARETTPVVPKPPSREETPATPSQPVTPRPAPTPPVASGNIQVVWRETFDADPAVGWSGEPEKTNTYQGTPGARKSTYNADSTYHANSLGFAQYRLGSKKYMGDAIFEAGDDVYISFQYYLSGTADSLKIYAFHQKLSANLNYEIKNVEKDKWAAAVIKTMDLWHWDKTKKVAAGDRFSEMAIAAGAPKTEGITFIIDNFTITKGGAPTDIELQLARASATTSAQTGDVKAEGFFLLPAVIKGLKQSYKPDAVAPKKVLRVGGEAAKSAFHVKVGDLEPLTRLTVLGAGKSAGDAKDKIESELTGQKPQIVTIMFDVADLTAGRQATDVKANYAAIVDAVLSFGAIPVLFTLPVPNTTDKDANKLITEHNTMILSVGREKCVPVIDAFNILNADPAKTPKYFNGFALRKDAQDAINAVFEKLYAKLKEFVIESKD